VSVCAVVSVLLLFLFNSDRASARVYVVGDSVFSICFCSVVFFDSVVVVVVCASDGVVCVVGISFVVAETFEFVCVVVCVVVGVVVFVFVVVAT